MTTNMTYENNFTYRQNNWSISRETLRNKIPLSSESQDRHRMAISKIPVKRVVNGACRAGKQPIKQEVPVAKEEYQTFCN